MKTITPLTTFLRSSPSPRFLSSHFILLYSTNIQQLQKKRVEGGGEARATSQSFSSLSSQREELSRNVKVSVWWDLGNCPIPNGVNAIKVAKNITTALRVNKIKGPVTVTAFGDVMQLSRSVQESLSLTGVSLKHLPGGKDTVERSLLADLVFWVSQNPPPAHLFLISGDKEFANVLHRLRMNNYNILLASQDPAPGVLCSATSIMWHWYQLVKGENFVGKHFSEPPDGPWGSWYGHNRVPLEDPFADMEQPTCVQPEDSRLAIRCSKSLPVPKAIVSHICHVVNSYPKGVDIVKLQLELERNNVPMDENFFGYEKFSELLKSLSTDVKLHSAGDGQIYVHSVQSKISELACQNNVSEPFLQSKVSGTLDQKKATVANSNSKVSGSLHQQIASEPNQSRVPERLDQPKVVEPVDSCVRPSKISEANKGDGTHTQIEELNGRKSFVTSNANGKSSLQVDTAPTTDPPVDTKEDIIQLKEGHSSSIEKNDTINEVGFCRRVWSTIFRRNNDSPDKGSNNSSESNDSSEIHSTKAASFEKGNLEERLVTSSSSNLDESVLEEKEKRDSEENGMFGKIMKWCRSWNAKKNSDKEKGQFIEEANQINSLTDINEVFSKVAFWEETLSFLQTKGTTLISKSKTREQMAQQLQKEGPPHLSSLPESDLIHLVHLLISEKKWVEESISKTFPFKLIHPARKLAPSLNSHGSNELSSLFSGKLSEPNTRVPPFHERVDGKKRETSSGVCSVESNKNPSGRSRTKILADCRKLVGEKFNAQPDGFHMPNFKPSFRERFGYDLDHQKLGYRKLAALFVSIPGLVVDDNFVRPSKKSSKSIIPYNVESDHAAKVSNKDSELSDCMVKQTENDRKCNELGLIFESNSKKNCTRSGINGETKEEIEHVAFDNDSYLSEDSSDSETNDELDGKILTKNSGENKDSSILHLLDSFYSKNGRPQGSSR